MLFRRKKGEPFTESRKGGKMKGTKDAKCAVKSHFKWVSYFCRRPLGLFLFVPCFNWGHKRCRKLRRRNELIPTRRKGHVIESIIGCSRKKRG